MLRQPNAPRTEPDGTLETGTMLSASSDADGGDAALANAAALEAAALHVRRRVREVQALSCARKRAAGVAAEEADDGLPFHSSETTGWGCAGTRRRRSRSTHRSFRPTCSRARRTSCARTSRPADVGRISISYDDGTGTTDGSAERTTAVATSPCAKSEIERERERAREREDLDFV